MNKNLMIENKIYRLKYLAVLANSLTISYKLIVRLIQIDLELKKFKRRFKIIL